MTNLYCLYKLKHLIVLLLLCICFQISAQDKYAAMSDTLLNLSSELPVLNEKVNISVTKVSIQEFLRAVANSTGLNIDVDPQINVFVINNFSDVKVRDLLVYLCRQYNLELRIIGNIFNIYKSQKIETTKPKLGYLAYDSATNIISLDFINVQLSDIVREITLKTQRNLILSPGLTENKVTGFVYNMPFDNALEKFMYSNKLVVNKSSDNFYIIDIAPDISIKKEDGAERSRNEQKNRTRQDPSSSGYFDIKIIHPDSFSISAENAVFSDLLFEMSSKTGKNYFLSTKSDIRTTFRVNKVGFEDVLRIALQGTRHTYKKVDNVFLIADDNSPFLKECSIIKFQNRSIDKVTEKIPKSLKENLEIIESPELNSLLVSGPMGNVYELQNFVSLIDQVVPVILIEVILVDMDRNFTLKTGIKAALGEKKEKTSGTVFPEIDVTLGSDAINSTLKNSGIIGLQNLGNVMPNFYVKLSALEDQGLINIRSTPQLSTLNGHEATLSIGTTEYYLEEQSNLVGTQNPISTSMKVYKSLNAELAIMIKPFVAGDEQITLEIEVKQSDFTSRISPTAPPASISRNFKSQIRVKNQEMVLLGGLELTKTNDSGTGVPFLSRIPILKWFFSSRTKEDKKSKLNVFIRPTILS